MNELKPPTGADGMSYHEVWWDSAAAGDGPKVKIQVQLHEVWEWLWDGRPQIWRRCGESEPLSCEAAYAEGWRYVRPIHLHDRVMRRDGEPPVVLPDTTPPPH